MSSPNSTASTIFANEARLSVNIPSKHPYTREPYLKKLKQLVGRPLRGQPPRNIHIHGDPGVGKTLLALTLLNQLYELEPYVGEPNTIHHPVKSNPTDFTITLSLLEEIRHEAHIQADPVKRNISTEQALSTLIQDLHTLTEPTVLVFDNATELTAASYFLSQLTEQLEITGTTTPITLITISRSSTPFTDIDSATADRLTEEQLYLPKYTHPQLMIILSIIAETAFKTDILHENVIETCVKQVLNQPNSILRAKTLLYKAGELALENSESLVTPEHIEKVS